MAGGGGKQKKGTKSNDGIGRTKTVPVAKTKQVTSSNPEYRATRDGGFEMKRRELVTTIRNSTTYQVNGGIAGLTYRLNPSSGTTFTWLPAIASCFDQYVFQSCELVFVPSVGTQQNGRVGLWFDKNSEDSPPVEKVGLLNMGVVAETSPWESIRLRIPTDNVKRFCLGSGANTDAKLIDMGQIGFSTYSGPGTDEIGELFVVYKVVFYYPQAPGTQIQTLGISGGGVRTVEVGPVYFNTGRSGTDNDTTFFTPGIFFITVSGSATAYTAELPIGNAVINSKSTTSSGVGFTGEYNVTITRPGDGLKLQGTGFGTSITNAVRARITNRANP